MKGAEYKSSEIESTKDTSYLTLTGEPWCVFSKNFGEKWLCYNGTTLLIMYVFQRLTHLNDVKVGKAVIDGTQ